MIGLVFPGLAPSYYEDIKTFMQNSPFSKRRFEEASEVLGFSLTEAFKNVGDKDYVIMECAFLANTMAMLDHFYEEYRLSPQVVIGPSFGGIVAAIYVKSISYKEAVWITKESNKLSGEWYERLGDFKTHFVYNLSLNESNKIIEGFKSKGHFLELVGNMESVMCFCGSASTIDLLKRTLNNKPKCFSLHTMGHPIHSEILTPLRLDVEREVFANVQFKPPTLPIISDVDGRLINQSEQLKVMMSEGYDLPVRWDLVTKQMESLGIKEVYVVGPKNLFYQLLKNKIKTIKVDPDSIIKQAVTH